MLTIDPRPEILVAAFTCEVPRPLQEMPSPAWLTELLQLSAETPLQSSDEVRQKVRDLLRTHGYKPTGRGQAGLRIPAACRRGASLAIHQCCGGCVQRRVAAQWLAYQRGRLRPCCGTPACGRSPPLTVVTYLTPAARRSIFQGCTACRMPPGPAPIRSRMRSAPRRMP